MQTPLQSACQSIRAFGLPGITALAVSLLVPGAEGYRFFGSSDPADADRWDPAVWAPGETISFSVIDGPEWAESGWTAEDGLEWLEAALTAWREVETADIEWYAGGIENRPRPHLDDDLDGRNWFFVSVDNDESHCVHHATLGGETDTSGSTRITECDVHLCLQPDQRAEEGYESALTAILVHELGHCLGLGHAAQSPMRALFSTRFLPHDPVMSYGNWDLENPVTADDAVGASLLRPAAGFLEASGTVTGRVLVDGDPASEVHVYAVRAADGGVAVGAFTDAEGYFEIHGLDSGLRLPWVFSPRNPYAHGFSEDAVRDLEVRLLLLPFSVRPGDRVSGLELTGRRRGDR